MKLSMRLTMEGMIRALRVKALQAADERADEKAREIRDKEVGDERRA